MKQRVKIDSAILSFIIILTGFLYLFPNLYPSDQSFDNVMDFVGLLSVLKGTIIRMLARGHKKGKSNKGESLVSTGIYKLTRNPMYLGSFYMGIGFVLIVWPWWTLPLFAGLFYARFRKQVVKEEKHLNNIFGEEYNKYCKNVPRVFPTLDLVRKTKTRDIVNVEEALSTKEKTGLYWWPLLAVILETMQELIIYNGTDIKQTLMIFVSSIAIFTVIAWVQFKTRE